MKSQGYVIKRATMAVVASVLLLSVNAVAQEMRSEISVQGTGFFTKGSDGNGVRNAVTETGGVLVGYRYNMNRWIAAEADYGYSRNTQIYSGFTPARVQANIHQITGAAVVKLPPFLLFLRPFLLGGGGVLVFDPTNNQGGTFIGASQQTRGTFLYGGGVDCPLLSNHLALRVEYRGLVYKAPDFNVVSLNTDAWTHVAHPSAGFVFRF
jgi:outer membrane immunogenic protein